MLVIFLLYLLAILISFVNGYTDASRLLKFENMLPPIPPNQFKYSTSVLEFRWIHYKDAL